MEKLDAEEQMKILNEFKVIKQKGWRWKKFTIQGIGKDSLEIYRQVIKRF